MWIVMAALGGTAYALDCEYAIDLYEKAHQECRAGVQHEGVEVQPCEYTQQLKKNYLTCTEADEEEEDDEFWFDTPQVGGTWDCPHGWGGYLWTRQYPTACDDDYYSHVDSCEEIKVKFVDERRRYDSDEAYRMAMRHRSELMSWCGTNISICKSNLQEKIESGQLRNHISRHGAVDFYYGFDGEHGIGSREQDPNKHGWKAHCGYCPQFIEQAKQIAALVFSLCVGEHPLDLRVR